MPIYDYRCTACDHLSEVIHGINDPGPRFCESCGAEGTMRKGFATPAVLFKGSGWARKDRGSRAVGSETSSDGSRSKATSDSPASTSSGSGTGNGSPGSSGASKPTSSSTDD
jgi:putative FmdB family regulatory protein